MPLAPYKNIRPTLGQNVFIAPTAWVIGDVVIGDNVSIFFGAVLRGDVNPIRVGSGTNIQEGALLHSSSGLGDCIVGSNVTVGHQAIIHGCTVGDNCIIGMGSTLLDDAQVGSNTIIGANSLVSMGTVLPVGVLAFGSPARVIRDLTPKELHEIELSALDYQRTGKEYLAAIC